MSDRNACSSVLHVENDHAEPRSHVPDHRRLCSEWRVVEVAPDRDCDGDKDRPARREAGFVAQPDRAQFVAPYQKSVRDVGPDATSATRWNPANGEEECPGAGDHREGPIDCPGADRARNVSQFSSGGVFRHPAYRSSTVAVKTMTPTRPIAPATQNGNAGVTHHSSPPMKAAGAIARLRTR